MNEDASLGMIGSYIKHKAYLILQKYKYRITRRIYIYIWFKEILPVLDDNTKGYNELQKKSIWCLLQMNLCMEFCLQSLGEASPYKGVSDWIFKNFIK